MQSLVWESLAPGPSTDRYVLLRGVSCRLVFPLYRFNLKTEVYTGPANLAVVPDLSVNEVDILFGNEIAGYRVVTSISPLVFSVTAVNWFSSDLQIFEVPSVFSFPTSVVTRSQARKAKAESEEPLYPLDQTKHSIQLIFSGPMSSLVKILT